MHSGCFTFFSLLDILILQARLLWLREVETFPEATQQVSGGSRAETQVSCIPGLCHFSHPASQPGDLKRVRRTPREQKGLPSLDGDHSGSVWWLVPGSPQCLPLLPPGGLHLASREIQRPLRLSYFGTGSHALGLSLASGKSAEHQTLTSNERCSENLRELCDSCGAVWSTQLWGLRSRRCLLTRVGGRGEGGTQQAVSTQCLGSVVGERGRAPWPGGDEREPWRACPGAGRSPSLLPVMEFSGPCPGWFLSSLPLELASFVRLSLPCPGSCWPLGGSVWWSAGFQSISLTLGQRGTLSILLIP